MMTNSAKKIAIVNLKNGCGRTTVAMNLAATLASGGKRVLLVDADPQGELNHFKGLADIGMSLDREGQQFLRSAQPAGLAVMYGLGRSIEDRIEEASEIDRTEKLNVKWDWIIYDTGARIGKSLKYILSRCDQVIAPIQIDSESFQAIPRLLTFILDIKKQHSQLEFGGFLINDFNTGSKSASDVNAAKATLQSIVTHFPGLKIDSELTVSADIAQSRKILEPVSVMPDSRGKEMFTSLGQDISSRWNEIGSQPQPREQLQEFTPNSVKHFGSNGGKTMSISNPKSKAVAPGNMESPPPSNEASVKKKRWFGR